jgi:hypothetical protein
VSISFSLQKLLLAIGTIYLINAVTVHVDLGQNYFSGNATYQELAAVGTATAYLAFSQRIPGTSFPAVEGIVVSTKEPTCFLRRAEVFAPDILAS